MAIVGLRENVVFFNDFMFLLGETCMKKRQFMNLCIEIKVFDMFSNIEIWNLNIADWIRPAPWTQTHLFFLCCRGGRGAVNIGLFDWGKIYEPGDIKVVTLL